MFHNHHHHARIVLLELRKNDKYNHYHNYWWYICVYVFGLMVVVVVVVLMILIYLIIMMLAVIVIFFFFMFQNTHTPRERNLFANVKLFIIVLFIYELKKTIGIFIQYSGKQTNNQNNFIHSNPIFMIIIIIIRFFSYFESNIKKKTLYV